MARTLLVALVAACGGADVDPNGGDAGPTSDVPVTNPAGRGVLLYVGNSGGGYDIDEAMLATLYQGAGATVTTSMTMPTDLADDHGLLLVLSPTSGFPDPAPARALLARGGTVVVVTEHSTYGDHPGASAYLSAIGSSMSSLGGSRAGAQPLTITSVPGVTEGVAGLELFYAADIALGGRGTALGTRGDGAPGFGWEAVGAGQVLLVPDGSFFGYALDRSGNRTLLRNLTP